MTGLWLWRTLLLTVPVVSLTLVSAGCTDFSRGSLLRGAVDTTAPDPVEPPKASSGRRRPKVAAASESHSLEEENFARIRRSLRGLVAAEEAFFAENGAYSDDFSVIGFTPEENIQVRFLWISPEGWAASGTHAAIEGRDCVTFVGQAPAPPTTLKYVRSGREGVPVCDDAARPPEPGLSASPAPPVSADTGSALDLLNPVVAMKVDLRNLVRSQNTYFATQGIYSRRTEPLAIQYLWHHGVRVKILSADAQSWSARATHSRAPGRSCVIWVGAVAQRPITDGQRLRANAPGTPVCDE